MTSLPPRRQGRLRAHSLPEGGAHIGVFRHWVAVCAEQLSWVMAVGHEAEDIGGTHTRQFTELFILGL